MGSQPSPFQIGRASLEAALAFQREFRRVPEDFCRPSPETGERSRPERFVEQVIAAFEAGAEHLRTSSSTPPDAHEPQPNPAIRTIATVFGNRYRSADPWNGPPPAVSGKVQPPDGMVLVLADGTRWGITAHRLNDADQ